MIFSIYLIIQTHKSLGFTRPLTEISIKSRKSLFWEVERGRCIRLTILTPYMSPMSRHCEIINISQQACTACYGESFTFLLYYSAGHFMCFSNTLPCKQLIYERMARPVPRTVIKHFTAFLFKID
jgi:hypothetical protein